jgi:hypothetical protein
MQLVAAENTAAQQLEVAKGGGRQSRLHQMVKYCMLRGCSSCKAVQMNSIAGASVAAAAAADDDLWLRGIRPPSRQMNANSHHCCTADAGTSILLSLLLLLLLLLVLPLLLLLLLVLTLCAHHSAVLQHSPDASRTADGLHKPPLHPLLQAQHNTTCRIQRTVATPQRYCCCSSSC